MAFITLAKSSGKNLTQRAPAISVNKTGIGFLAELSIILHERKVVCAELLYDEENRKLGLVFYTDKETAPRSAYIIFGRGAGVGMGIACRYHVAHLKMRQGTIYDVVWDDKIGGYVTTTAIEIDE
jgi:hypothetical protein